MMRTACVPRDRIAAAIFVVLCALPAGAVRAESELALVTAGRTATYAPAALLGMPSAATVEVTADPVYRRTMTFRALPMAALIEGASGDDTVRFSTADGRSMVIPTSLLLGRPGGAGAYLAVEPDDARWPPIRDGGHATAGPFHLVWTHPERAGIAEDLWPRQIVRIEALPPLARRFPAVVPAAGVSSRSPVRRGYTVYARQCASCHAINGAGDSTLGPDLNLPYNPTEYLRMDALRRLIRDPQSLRRWPETRMPAYTKVALSDRDLTDLVDYLRYMADRKAAAAR